MKRLAIITTHPIQYNAPWFKLLASRDNIRVKVFYTWGEGGVSSKFDPGFGKVIDWDIPLLEGYEYAFIKNTSKNPGSHHRKGIVNPSLIEEIQDWNPNALLVFGWNFVSHFNCIRYFHKKIPVIFRGDSTLLRKQNVLKKTIRKHYLRWVYHFIDYALYVGKENKKYFIEHGLKNNQLVYAPHAIDNERFNDKDNHYETAANKWKLELNINPSSLTVLYAGKLEDIKSPTIIVELAKKMNDHDINFIIAGNGPLEKDLKKMAVGNNRIKFLDFCNQKTMPVLYRLADVFILSSKSETWGLSVNEAMACGRAVIIRNTCGCAIDLVVNGKNGYIFDSEKMDTVYEHLKNLLMNKTSCEAMGKRSLQMIQPYSFENIATSVESLMEKF